MELGVLHRDVRGAGVALMVKPWHGQVKYAQRATPGSGSATLARRAGSTRLDDTSDLMVDLARLDVEDQRAEVFGSRETDTRWHAARMHHAEVLLIGGRAGVGKTTVGWEVSALLRAVSVPHAVIDGDFMGQVHPAPPGDPHRSEITEANLTAVWANFARHGCRRLIYTNTLCVLPEATGMFESAMGPKVRIVRVLLTASDATARERLTRRELGSELAQELSSSARKARLLDQRAPAETLRVETDRRAVVDIAREVVTATGLAAQPTSSGR